MSAVVPVRDKSDIPTKPFPKTNKQSLPLVRACVCICTCAHLCVIASIWFYIGRRMSEQ